MSTTREPDPDRGGARPAGHPDHPRVRRARRSRSSGPASTPSCSCSGCGPRSIDTDDRASGTPAPAASGATRPAARGDGFSMGFYGSFHEVRPGRAARADLHVRRRRPTAVSLETMTFEALEGGRCRTVGTSVVETIEIRDQMLASGMETGVRRGLREARRAAARRSREPRPTSTARSRATSPAAWSGATDWDAPAPVDGWVARDVVRPPGRAGSRRSSRPARGVRLAGGPSVDDDPVGAWQAHARRGPGAARRPRDAVEGAEQPAHRRGAARRGGRPLLHRRRLHAHLGPGAGDRPGRDARRRAVRGDARRHGADGRGAPSERSVRPAGRGARPTPTLQTRLIGVHRARPVVAGLSGPRQRAA